MGGKLAVLPLTRGEPVDPSYVSGVARSRAKRTCDVVGAAALLVLFAPLVLVLSVLIKLESRGPVLYRCRRVGLHGREFFMLKFRKMHRDASGPLLTAADDDRLTHIGSFLTKTKLDELPQLWNVLRGEMSLVGPRPEDPAFVALYPTEYSAVLSVRPGVTGLSQLAFAREDRVLARPELAGSYESRLLPAKIGMDTLYIDGWSLALDARIVAWTAAAIVLRAEVAVHRTTGRLGVRRRAGDEQLGTARRVA
jgi:lipopolysaccharide/colanic/teichoic acid biosynthesis glycosyltransferase